MSLNRRVNEILIWFEIYGIAPIIEIILEQMA